MMTSFRSLLIGLAVVVVALGALSCSKTETTKLQLPTVYSEESLNAAMQLIEQGYMELNNGNLDGALAKFAQVDSLVPKTVASLYHSVCAHARTGDKEKALANLSTMADKGYDRFDELSQDTDFDILRDDPRFVEVAARVKKNYETASAAFASGMPEFATPPQQFAAESELTAWADKESRLIQMCGRVWNMAEYNAARIDFTARRLACLREFKKTDSTFDYGLERVRAVSRFGDLYAPGWGTMSDLIVKEADQFLKSSPAVEKASEVNFHAGLALSLKYGKDDSLRLGAYQRAQGYLASVADGSPFTAAARALVLINQTHSPNADPAALGPQFKTVVDQHPSDPSLWRLMATQFENEAAPYIWPIPLERPDLDGKNVSLADYAGKAVLIDFWATWCPPCRAELPNLVAVYNQYHPKGLEVLSVSLDYGQQTPVEAYRQWIDSAGMNWRHIYDGNAWGTDLVRRFFVGSIPAPFLIGKDGAIVAMGENLRGEKLEQSVKTALGI